MQTTDSEIEKRVIRKLSWRLIPLLIACYVIAVIDRANIGVAALTMNADIGLSAASFGLAAGLFFVPYALLELPSNLLMERIGARWWIARIMVTWGLVSGAHIFVWNENSLYVMRALLGAAEAGFFPGIVFYLTMWFPAAWRGRIIASFMTGIPIALIIGTPISSLLLELHGWMGLSGWQIMFLIEAIPAIALGLIVPFALPDKPKDAKFLEAEEQRWLMATLAAEQKKLPSRGHGGLLKALFSPLVLLFSLTYYGLANLNGAVSTFLPLIISETGLSHVQTGFITIIPYIFGLIGMLVLGRIADRPGSRLLANYAALLISCLGLLCVAWFDNSLLKMAFLCCSAFGFFGAMPVFWGLPAQFFPASVVAGSIALINALGSIASVVNPWVIGIIRDRSGSYNGGFYWLAAMALLSIITLSIIFRRQQSSVYQNSNEQHEGQ
ncbi:MFS transporter [Raoultella sp. WB_B2P2-3]|uniref:MFS transporter n=1 Tax=Raoultella scottii TaxID=3040937 RepID=A0ABU8ZAW9_9ENTR|nr:MULTISPECIES: MFS transporter [Enterobacteriaceae]MVT01935.1 MFS transporter [Raoultella sp. 10-1]PAC14455.1 MFS transporter [Enterobacter sp. 10-1]